MLARDITLHISGGASRKCLHSNRASHNCNREQMDPQQLLLAGVQAYTHHCSKKKNKIMIIMIILHLYYAYKVQLQNAPAHGGGNQGTLP